jgi:hypothetical protein
MLLLDILLRDPPAWFGGAVAQATAAATRGAWTKEDGAEVIPLAIPGGVWLDVDTSFGKVGVGVEDGALAVRAPAALAWLIRSKITTRATRPDGQQTVLVLNLQQGVVTWLPLPGLQVGLRLVADVSMGAFDARDTQPPMAGHVKPASIPPTPQPPCRPAPSPPQQGARPSSPPGECGSSNG